MVDLAIYLSILIVPLIAIWLIMWTLEKKYSTENLQSGNKTLFKIKVYFLVK